jgi:hypothetical protein
MLKLTNSVLELKKKPVNNFSNPTYYRCKIEAEKDNASVFVSDLTHSSCNK